MSHQSPVALCLALLAGSVLASPGALNESAPAVAEIIPWPNPTLAGCEESRPFTLLDNFADGDEEDDLGAYWFPMVDSISYRPFPGRTSDPRSWEVSNGYPIVVNALDSTLAMNSILKQCQEPDTASRRGTSSLVKDFNGLGTLLGGDSLTGISFELSVPKSGPLIRSLRFFAVQEEGDSGWSERVVDLPFSGIDSGASRRVCIRPSDLRLGGYAQGSTPKPIDPRGFFQLEWLVKMPSSPNPYGSWDTTIFKIDDIRLHGSRSFQSSSMTTPICGRDNPLVRWVCTGFEASNPSPSIFPYRSSLQWNSTCTNPNVGTRPRSRPTPALAVHTESNSLLLTGTDGFRQFEILSADGRSLKRFAPTSRLQIGLPRGAYLLVGEGPNKREVRPFAVAR